MKSKWKMGDVNPETNYVFLAYQDKARTRVLWLTQENYIKKKAKHKEYQQSRSISYYKKRYDNIRQDDLLRRRKSWANRIEKTPMSIMFYVIRNGARNRNLSLSITTIDLEEIWDKQNGLCYYTGISMIKEMKTKDPRQVSADRIVSTIGYELGNVVLCCQAINFAKSSYSADVFKAFLNEIITHDNDQRANIK